MRKIIIVIISIIISFNLYSKPLQTYDNGTSKIEVDTIYQKIDTTTITLIVYRPINSHAYFTTTRPDSNDTRIKISVAAAFTGKDLKSIMGKYIEKGNMKWGYKSIANGYVSIIDGKVSIQPINHSLKTSQTKAIRKRGYLFQQMLLVNDSIVMDCRIFGERETYRRALVIINNNPCIIESEQRLKINDFSASLVRMGIKTAICLDMGTWSHGWIRTEGDNYIPIGKLTSSTANQTNWLIFTD
ncbi:MAG: hypothetical protein WCR29_00360 [Bacteroidales bacterium]|nr:hypothetical protein [Bacteroidales bacterium]